MCSLSIGSSLRDGKYIIKTKVSQEGLFFSYYALQTSLDRIVVVREFYMRDFCSRETDGKNVIIGKDFSEQVETFKVKFLADARSYANEEDGSIKVFDIFEENNTAYYVFLGEEDIVLPEPEEKIEGKEEVGKIEEVVASAPKEAEKEAVIDVVKEEPATDSSSETQLISSKGNTESKYKKYLTPFAICLVIGFLGTYIFFLAFPFGSQTSKDDKEPSEIYVVDSCTVDSIDYTEETTQPSFSQQDIDKYIRLSQESLEKAKKNAHKQSGLQYLLDARFYYYDKADKANVAVNGVRLPANKEIDDFTEKEYQYWVEKAKKLGSSKRNYELKRTYLKRAKSISFRHQNVLDSQIKWLTEQIDKQHQKK